MNKQRNQLLAQMRYAHGLLKSQRPEDVTLVKAIYDTMLHVFGDPVFLESLSDEEYAKEWNLCRDSVKQCLVSNHLIDEVKFTTIWGAYDIITLEQAQAFA